MENVDLIQSTNNLKFKQKIFKLNYFCIDLQFNLFLYIYRIQRIRTSYIKYLCLKRESLQYFSHFSTNFIIQYFNIKLTFEKPKQKIKQLICLYNKVFSESFNPERAVAETHNHLPVYDNLRPIVPLGQAKLLLDFLELWSLIFLSLCTQKASLEN